MFFRYLLLVFNAVDKVKIGILQVPDYYATSVSDNMLEGIQI